MRLGLEAALGALGLDLLDGLGFGDFTIAAALGLVGGRGAELFALGPDEFLLPVDLHLDVLLVLAVELRLLLLIAQLADEVLLVAHLLVLHLQSR